MLEPGTKFDTNRTGHEYEDGDELSETRSNECLKLHTKARKMKPQLVIKYNFQLITTNPVDSQSSNNVEIDSLIEGYMLLTMPCGKYPTEIYQNQKKLLESTKRFLEGWIISQNFCTEVNPAEFLQLDEHPIRHTFFVGAPLLQKSSRKFRIFLKFAVCQWTMNDFMDKSMTTTQCIPFLSLGFFADLGKIVANIIGGTYRHVDAVPYFEIPLFYECLTALFEVYQEVKQNIGVTNYEKYHTYLLKEMLDWIESQKIATHSLCGNSFVGRPHLGMFDSTYLGCRRLLDGRGALLELIQLLDETFLDESVREKRLFRMFCDTAIVIHNLSRDLFLQQRKWSPCNNSVQRDFLFRTHSHYRLRDWKEVYETTQETINDAIVDFQRIGECILRDYPGKEKVKRFVDNVQCFVDGGIRAIVEDWRSDKQGEFQIMRVKKHFS